MTRVFISLLFGFKGSFRWSIQGALFVVCIFYSFSSKLLGISCVVLCFIFLFFYFDGFAERGCRYEVVFSVSLAGFNKR